MRISQSVNVASLDSMFSDQNLNTFQIHDVGRDIENALGVSVDDIQSSEVVLVTLLVDDSTSIARRDNEQIIRDGCNLIVESLREARISDDVLMHTRFLNGTILYPYTLLDDVVELTSENYRGTGSTPLYDQTMVMLQTVSTKVAEFADNGVPARTVSLIVTDGADYGSYNYRPHNVNLFLEEFLAQEMHVVLAMGIEDNYTNFREVFSSMGIPDNCILLPNDTKSAIREAFQTASQSAVRVSQAADMQALGGFATHLEID